MLEGVLKFALYFKLMKQPSILLGPMNRPRLLRLHQHHRAEVCEAVIVGDLPTPASFPMNAARGANECDDCAQHYAYCQASV